MFRRTRNVVPGRRVLLLCAATFVLLAMQRANGAIADANEERRVPGGEHPSATPAISLAKSASSDGIYKGDSISFDINVEGAVIPTKAKLQVHTTCYTLNRHIMFEKALCVYGDTTKACIDYAPETAIPKTTVTFEVDGDWPRQVAMGCAAWLVQSTATGNKYLGKVQFHTKKDDRPTGTIDVLSPSFDEIQDSVTFFAQVIGAGFPKNSKFYVNLSCNTVGFDRRELQNESRCIHGDTSKDCTEESALDGVPFDGKVTFAIGEETQKWLDDASASCVAALMYKYNATTTPKVASSLRGHISPEAQRLEVVKYLDAVAF